MNNHETSQILEKALSILKSFELTDFERLTIATKLMEVTALADQAEASHDRNRVIRGIDCTENLGDIARALWHLGKK